MDSESRPIAGLPRALAALAIALLPFAALARPAAAADAPPPFARTESRQPCADYDPLRTPFFGDLHVHTTYSLDASTQGTRNTPRDAYRFARGDSLGIQPYDDHGHAMRQLQLARPLDFAAVTDHAELFGEQTICTTPGMSGYHSPVCFIYRHWPRLAFFLMNSRSTNSEAPVRYGFCGEEGKGCLAAALTPWRAIRDAAEEAYDRSAACTFTTFVGYEWTGGPGSNNIHRNVLFRNEIVPVLPISYVEAPQPQELWRRLAGECLTGLPGCDVLTIPHNSNLSGGLMFQTVNADGSPITTEDALARAAFEPLVEIMQHKGDSECRLGPETTDELCGFEKLPYQNFMAHYLPWTAKKPGPMNFVRNVLKEGLVQEQKLGANPFKFGLVASTDTHIAAPGQVAEDQHPGHGGAGAPAATRAAARPAGRRRVQPRRPGGAVGGGELARLPVRRHAAPRGVRHQRPAHDRALLRRLGLPVRPVRRQVVRRDRLRARRADGWGPAGADVRGAALRRLGAARSRRAGEGWGAAAARADHQGMGRGWTGAREGVRRRRRSATTAPPSTWRRAFRRGAASTICARCGAIRTSIRRSGRSTTRGCWRTRAAAGAPMRATRTA